MNPTLPLFFLALFSQFVRETAPWQETVIITATAGGIDIIWYILVALVLSHTAVLDRLRRRAHIFDRVFGVILLGLAITQPLRCRWVPFIIGPSSPAV